MINFKIIDTKTVFEGRVFDVKVDNIKYKSGNDGIREVVIHNGGAVVVPVTTDGKIVMVTQYRYPFGKKFLELPAGKLEKDEDPFVCAERELTEETGYTGEKIIKLGKIATSPGFCTELLHIYLARNLSSGKSNREEGEYGMEVFEFSLQEVEEKIRTGEIIDSKTICGIFYYRSLLQTGK